MKRTTLFAAGMLLLAQVAAAQLGSQDERLAGSGIWGWTYYDDNPIYSVSLSGDGATAIVGGSGGGVARMFVRSGRVWSRQADVPVGSGVAGAGAYSAAISGSGDTAIVGGPVNDGGTGAVWIYERTGEMNDRWEQQQPKLVGSGAGGRAYQGFSVAISWYGDTAVVGGPWDVNGIGAAWVFSRTGWVWSQQAKLVGPYSGLQPFQGTSVAISADGSTVIVGGPNDADGMGAAWVYTRAGGTWSLQQKLFGSGAAGRAGQGRSVALSPDGDTAIVGGPNDADGAGAAWVFTRANGAWSQQGSKVTGNGAVGAAGLGTSVAISSDGSRALAGGPEDDSGAGAAWIFTRAGTVWAQEGDKLVGGGAIGPAHQGQSVAMSSNGAAFIVGGPTDGDGGAAWAYSSRPAPSWVPVVAHSDGANGSRWRSDFGLLNPGATAASVEVRFHGPGAVVSSTTNVPAGAQSILRDVVGELGAAGQGALEIIADRSLMVTARTYNQAAPEAGCLANGTQGQDYPVVAASSGLAAGQSAFLPALVEDDAYRTNIGVVNMGEATATILVELCDGAGTTVAEYTRQIPPGRWRQEIQPFRYLAGETAMSGGYSRITVQSGAGVFALASVIDNITNDPTTVAMQR
ncbi:MAG TPA: hypothetical protein PLM61_06940 [Thermoanaerobaculales bacterium]|nr:hypothetical protein [Thermoanaerobaculales bacterium]HQP43088.1 hypothetical protein [Thermoanaerobaculales bacterium]